MFAKPFKIKSQTAIKGSDRKKLRSHVTRDFPSLTPDTLTELVPVKDEMSVVKIYTNGGDSAIVYVLLKNPIFFEIFDNLYPTVYTLWKCPELLPVFTTWPPVFRKLVGGADLMLPGVVLKTSPVGGDDGIGIQVAQNLPVVAKGDLCAINLAGNRSPVALGRALLSSSDMVESGMKGKGIRISHIFGDELWSFGDKTEPPVVVDPAFSRALNSAQSYSDDEELSDSGTPLVESLTLNDQPEADADKENDDTDGAKGGNTQPEESETQPLTISAENMDRFLYEALLTALKTRVKNTDLPLLTSNLYRNFMLPCSVKKEVLDVKKSSYKKLSKFLNSVAKGGLIKLKESKGVESLTAIDKSHPEYRAFVLDEIVVAEEESSHDNQSGDHPIKVPQIQEMYSVTSVMLPIFKPAGYSKSSALSSAEVRSVIKEYVKVNDLQVENRKSVVQLDPVLADVVLAKGEVNTTHLSWEELSTRFLQKMLVVHQVTLPGQAPVIRKGKMEPIVVDVVQRASNKKVTLIENLESYGIDPVEFAHKVQVSVACSASTNQMAQKNRGLQIVVQGNQINFVADLLLGEYQIPRKFIKGLEKGVKSGRKK